MERRLAAILAADVVGYSRLIGIDEAGTLNALRSCRSGLIEPKVTQYKGRIVKLTGDGVLAEFASAVEAVRCAVEIQCALGNREAASSSQIKFRIGINIGDIVIEDDDIYGDGVNVAARLEALAAPGGICVSSNIVEQVDDKLDLTFIDQGEKRVKNIAQPLSVYAVSLDEKATALTTPVMISQRGARRWPVLTGLAAATLLIIGAGIYAWQPWQRSFEPVRVDEMLFSLPDKPSIAILPFDNLSGDPDQQYFADGLAEDLTTDLSRNPDLFVVSRNSAFSYRGKSIDVRQVAMELGVRYVMEGSVRRLQNSVRINAQLIDATTGGHVWADRYDVNIAELHAAQDAVMAKIISAMQVRLADGVQISSPGTKSDNPDAYDAFLKGLALYRRASPADFASAVALFEYALERDSEFSRVHATLAALYSEVIDRNWSTGTSVWSLHLGLTTDNVISLEGEHLAAALVKPDPLAHRVASARHTRAGQHNMAIAEARRALALDPNDPVAHEALASALIFAGRPGEAHDVVEMAIRLDPGNREKYLYWQGLANFGKQAFAEAASALQEATGANADDDRSAIVLAASYAFLGDLAAARQTIEQTNELRITRQKRLADPAWRPGIDMLLVGPYTLKDIDFWYFKEEADLERLRQGLRLAGVAEVGKDENVSPTFLEGATTVDAQRARQLFDEGVAFVDVRGEESWNAGHIPGAVHQPLKTGFTEAALLTRFGKDDPFVVYCMGPRCLLSSQACKLAVFWGFKKVHYFRDGFPAWKAAGYEVEIP
jgi:TolB-like protein/class 3 adenylate cyclase/rhodanese-related sulfurtransferase